MGLDRNVEATGNIVNGSEVMTHKAKIYAGDLKNNLPRLKDKKYFDFYGAFQGSEGAFRFNLRQEMERLAQGGEIIFASQTKPENMTENSLYFVKSVLSGQFRDTIAAVWTANQSDHVPGEIYESIRETAKQQGLNEVATESIVGSFSDIKQTLTHQLPYLENGDQGEIKVLFPVKPKKNENLQTEEELPPEYARTLAKIKEIAPKKFYEQARKCARLFHNLDQGKIGPEEENFATELAQLPPIANIDFFNNLRGVGFEAATPTWLHDKKIPIEQKARTEKGKVIADFYQKYVAENSIYNEKGRHGIYANFDRNLCPPEGVGLTDNFKAYIEEEVPNFEEKMDSLFKLLRDKKIHPSSSKLFEGNRLVLYWNSRRDDELVNNLRECFEKSGIRFRGFGQDSVRIEIDENGNWTEEIAGSNDQSRGEGSGGERFFEHTYETEKFFQMYIKQAFKWGKNPLDLNRISFVPVMGDINKIKDKESLFKRIREIEASDLEVQV